MAELIQATPLEIANFGTKCSTSGTQAAAIMAKVKPAIKTLEASWGGQFAKAFGSQWQTWQKEMQEFVTLCETTSTEMTTISNIYVKGDEEATAVIGTTWTPGDWAATTTAAAMAIAGLGAKVGQGLDLFQKLFPKRFSGGLLITGTLLDVWSSKTPEEALASVAHTALMFGACTNPLGLGIVIANAGTQLGGDAVINLATWTGQCIGNDYYDKLFLNNEKKLLDARKKIDFPKVTKSLMLNFIVRPFSSEDRPNRWEAFDETVKFGFGMRDMATGLLIHLGIGIKATGNRIGSGAEWVYSEMTTPTRDYFTVTSDSVVPPVGGGLPQSPWKTGKLPQR